MSCYYCQKEGRSTPDAGSCAICSKDVCTHPPLRFDGIFHGDECKCGCPLLICDPHMTRHARDRHSSDPFRCFPLSGFAAGNDALLAAGSLLYGAVPPERAITPLQMQAMSRLLISMIPGATILAEVLSRRPTSSWTWDRQTLASTRESLIQFQPDFFTRAMVTGILVLAARTTVQSWRYGPRDRLLAGRRLLTYAQVHSLNALESLGQDQVDMSASAILPWLAGRDVERGREIAEELHTLDIPHDPEHVALWIDRTDQGTSREPAVVMPGLMGSGEGAATGAQGASGAEAASAASAGAAVEEETVGSRR